jgi:tRNA-splicing ligase RtcB
MSIRTFGDHDAATIQQLENCVSAEEGATGVLCADGHLGYSMPIGGVVAYREHLSPSGVGFDIACLAAGTPVAFEDGYNRPIEAVGVRAPVVCWDGGSVRRAVPCDGAVARGHRPVRALALANGRTLRATDDHEIRTKLGWLRVDALRPGDAVACPVFRGLPFDAAPAAALGLQLPPAAVARRRVDREAELRDRGLWPLRPADPRFPALLRILGYAAGDGHLARNGTRLTIYTTVLADAAALAGDLERLGFPPCIHARDRGPGRRREHAVYVDSVAFHALLCALGLPVGAKVAAWRSPPFPWLFDLPAWMRAQFLSAFASAAGSTPSISNGCLAAPAMQQSATTDHIVRFLVRLLASLGFAAGVSVSGPARGDRITRVVQVLGGEPERLRFLEEVGFCRAVEKREAAARAASLAWATAALRQARQAAADEARALAHHASYGRGAPRRGKDVVIAPDHSGEIAWVSVTSVTAAGDADVFDVVTGDAAASFVGGGICVHNWEQGRPDGADV